ncbi:ArsC/Spx/MgsR family protein [Ulvibacter antarcticus]|uniref:Arsenate reductase n=1 Tax=Ulvibacter antarcticus TaxID=442714 RepID=A0A3L9Z074_9FLAO|nr:ArsC/Spx/MgsR family protein [Ulvibacter antarcticus]RMA66243.1 arsenate reductase [Ulvibacter antarcticus]
MFTIYHDPGCVFSVTCLVILRASNAEYNKVEYKKEPFTREILEFIIKSLGVKASDLINKKQRTWKYLYEPLDLNDEELIQLMMDNPDLIVRPIIVSGNKAIIGRPPVNLIRFMRENKKVA